MTSVTPTAKRTHEDVVTPEKQQKKNSGDSERTKRSRRSRWEDEDDQKAVEQPAASASAVVTPPAKGALSEIVKKLSNVVKEKSTPQQLAAAAAVAPSPAAAMTQLFAATTSGGVPTIIDAETAKAKALAQASLLSMNLPVSQVSPNDLAKRLYIGNLYYELKDEDIRNTFAPFGAIRSIDLSVEPGCGRSKGFCFLEYDDVLAAESAVQVLNGSQLANRAIKVGRPLRGSANPGDANAALSIGQQAIKTVPTKVIYFAGVRVELNSHHLESIFSPFGEIRACVMTAVSPLESGVHRGYGFLEFAEESCATNAIQHMNGFELAGQNLKVGKASPAAMLINLATSKDKIVRTGQQEPLATNGLMQIPKKTAAFDDADIEAVKDDATDDDKDQKRCLCLFNLVNKGEVDDELEDEVRIECGKFGIVERVEIHELDDHVRVFVVFDGPDSAANAKQALHGRFFGGNEVQAHYYSMYELINHRYHSAFL